MSSQCNLKANKNLALKSSIERLRRSVPPTETLPHQIEWQADAATLGQPFALFGIQRVSTVFPVQYR